MHNRDELDASFAQPVWEKGGSLKVKWGKEQKRGPDRHLVQQDLVQLQFELHLRGACCGDASVAFACSHVHTWIFATEHAIFLHRQKTKKPTFHLWARREYKLLDSVCHKAILMHAALFLK